MGLGTAKAHVMGRQQQFYAVTEDVNGQYAEPQAADAFNILTTSFNPKVNRTERMEAYLATRDLISGKAITGKSEHAWAMDCRYTPSGTKNVAPRLGRFMKAALGVETVGADDVTYSLNSAQTLDTMSLTRYFQALMMEAMAGAWLETLTISGDGASEPKFHVDGGAFDYAATGYTTSLGAQVADATAFNVAAGGGVNFHNPASTSLYARGAVKIGAMPSTGEITSATDATGGEVLIVSAAHGLVTGNHIVITSMTDYNGIFLVTLVDADSFKITDTYVGDETSGTWVCGANSGTMTVQADNGDGGTTCTSNAHGMVDGQVVTTTDSTSGNYDGTFNIFNVGVNTFDIDTAFVADDGDGEWLARNHMVTARTTDALTIAPPLDIDVATLTAVAPYVPAHSHTETPISGIVGSLDWDNATFPVTSFEVTLKNNIKALNDHAQAAGVEDLIPNIRTITGKFTARLRQDFIIKLLARQDFAAKALSIICGGAALLGTRLAITASYCELEYSEIGVPEAEEATVDFTFRAYGSAGNDALTLMHT